MAHEKTLAELSNYNSSLEKTKRSIFGLTSVNLFLSACFFILLQFLHSTEVDRNTILYCLFLATFVHLLLLGFSAFILFRFSDRRKKGLIRFDYLRLSYPQDEKMQMTLGDFDSHSNLPITSTPFFFLGINAFPFLFFLYIFLCFMK